MYENLITLTEIDDLRWLHFQASRLPDQSTILELGSFLMGSATAMARANKNIIVHAVDIGWLKWLDDPKNPAVEYLSKKHPTIQLNEKSAQKIRSTALKSAHNIIWHQKWSREVIPDVAPSFCFIDADHSSTSVLADFFHCWNISKTGATIAGHDYQLASVQNAVEKISLIINSKPTFATSQIWYWTKSEALD